MADPVTNARQLKASLAGRLKKLDEERAALMEELANVDRFLGAADAYANVDPSIPKAPTTRLPANTPARKRPQNPPREQVLEVVAEAIERTGRPMQLRELYEAVTTSGIDLQGTDPAAVLGTMIWRAKKRFTNIKGRGYWLADRPFEPAGYEP